MLLFFLEAELLLEGSSGDVLQKFGPEDGKIKLRFSNEACA
jgi:hypothetical protein